MRRRSSEQLSKPPSLLPPFLFQVSSIFFAYAKATGAGAAVSSVRMDETMQENELASLVRDTGLATEAFPIGRIHTLYKSVATNDQLTLPGFVNLLLLIAVHRANPKFGTVGKDGCSRCLFCLLGTRIF